MRRRARPLGTAIVAGKISLGFATEIYLCIYKKREKREKEIEKKIIKRGRIIMKRIKRKEKRKKKSLDSL